MKSAVGMGLSSLAVLLVIFPVPTFAEQANTAFMPSGDLMAIEKQVLPMNISADNKLPWGFVEGTAFNPVEGYPVIIQIYKDGKPVHFAQTSVNEDGTFEYKFRVRNVDGDQVTNAYQGDYTVKIFKVVYLDSDYLEYLANLEKQGRDVSITVLTDTHYYF